MNDLFLQMIFENESLRISKDNIVVLVVNENVIKGKNANTQWGFTEVSFDERNNVISALILIDENLNFELKLSILYHEYGHILHYRVLGMEQMQMLREQNDYEWVVKDEYEAFKYELRCLMNTKISYLLRNSIFRLIQRFDIEGNNAYREALSQLYKDEEWIDYRTIMKLN